MGNFVENVVPRRPDLLSQPHARPPLPLCIQAKGKVHTEEQRTNSFVGTMEYMVGGLLPRWARWPARLLVLVCVAARRQPA